MTLGLQRHQSRHRVPGLWVTGNRWECDRRRWDDEMRARERARRTGVIAGVAAYAIVRN